MDQKTIQDVRERLRAEVHRVVVGQDAVIDLMAVALLAEGHVLLEGVPGTAKTLLAQAFAACLALPFKRIQFTPDLMPGDVLGTSLYNFATQQFTLTRGPVFTEVLLADEVNRTPPKTQAALLQAMQERAVTLDGRAHELSSAFMVIATQNPIEQEGTYPLPEAQMDRFLLKIRVGYPSPEEEARILDRMGGEPPPPPRPVIDVKQILAARHSVNGIYLDERIRNYVVDLVHATREPERFGLDVRPLVQYGASPRATLALARGARALAFLEGRAYVTPDDVKTIAPDVFRHRVLLTYEAEAEGVPVDEIVRRILARVEVP